MRGVAGFSLFTFFAVLLLPATPIGAQQSPDSFHWVDFHSPQDQSVVIWVTNALAEQKWTAIREIGVEYDAALVVTTLRRTPQTPPNLDTFSLWSVSLTTHNAKLLLSGANLRILDWMLFAIGWPRELGILYDDCNECDAATFLTALRYDDRVHGWAARWMRGSQAIPVSNATAPQGVAASSAYAVLADSNGLEEVGTWNHLDFGSEKPPEDYVYLYDVNPADYAERTQLLHGSQADALKRRICLGSDAVSGLERGQDSSLCQPFRGPALPRKGAH